MLETVDLLWLAVAAFPSGALAGLAVLISRLEKPLTLRNIIAAVMLSGTFSVGLFFLLCGLGHINRWALVGISLMSGFATEELYKEVGGFLKWVFGQAISRIFGYKPKNGNGPNKQD